VILAFFKRRRDDASPELVEVERLVAKARASMAPLERDALYRDAAHATVRAMATPVRRFCRDRMGDDALGDEAAQQTWLVFWRVLPRFEGRSRLTSFLFGIARNTCNDLRRLRKMEVLEGQEVVVWPDFDDRIERERRHRAMASAVATLGPAARWLLEQRLIEERSYGEILPVYQAIFGPGISTEEGLRTLFFKAKRELIAALGGRDE
jgi:RNA polymerase sigma factor (sigma-70 family)